MKEKEREKRKNYVEERPRRRLGLRKEQEIYFIMIKIHITMDMLNQYKANLSCTLIFKLD